MVPQPDYQQQKLELREDRKKGGRREGRNTQTISGSVH